MLSEERLADIRNGLPEDEAFDDECVCGQWSDETVRALLADRDELAAEVERLRGPGTFTTADMNILTRQRDEARAEITRLIAEVERLKPLAAIGEAMQPREGILALSVQMLADSDPEHRWHYAIDTMAKVQSVQSGWAKTLLGALRAAGLIADKGADNAAE